MPCGIEYPFGQLGSTVSSPVPHILEESCWYCFLVSSSSSRQCASSVKPFKEHISLWQQQVNFVEHHFGSSAASGQCLTPQTVQPTFLLPSLLRALLDVVTRFLTALKPGLCLKIQHAEQSVLLVCHSSLSHIIILHASPLPPTVKMLGIQGLHYGKDGMCASGAKVS